MLRRIPVYEILKEYSIYNIVKHMVLNYCITYNYRSISTTQIECQILYRRHIGCRICGTSLLRRERFHRREGYRSV